MQKYSREQQPYTPLFCEENVWQLAHRLLAGGCEADTLQVLLFSNQRSAVFMLNQRSAPPDKGIIWDYHVVLRINDGSDLVLDPDSRLPYPSATRDYLALSFPAPGTVPSRFRSLVRIIPAARYVLRFDSDRNHMRGRIPAQAFPQWPLIRAGSDPITLRNYRDMTASLDDGSRVVTIEEFAREVG
ncbi:MAG: hypothetical protein KDI82_00505 [Gammaproteobacteria bacterium]|nr:hypothetical protein [Gammaproteobacteria bacterium]